MKRKLQLQTLTPALFPISPDKYALPSCSKSGMFPTISSQSSSINWIPFGIEASSGPKIGEN